MIIHYGYMFVLILMPLLLTPSFSNEAKMKRIPRSQTTSINLVACSHGRLPVTKTGRHRNGDSLQGRSMASVGAAGRFLSSKPFLDAAGLREAAEAAVSAGRERCASNKRGKKNH